MENKVFKEGPMTDHDRLLLEEVHDCKSFSMCTVNESDAETKEGYKKIHNAIVNLYHKEEAECGML